MLIDKQKYFEDNHHQIHFYPRKELKVSVCSFSIFSLFLLASSETVLKSSSVLLVNVL